LFHLDLYRLDTPQQIAAAGLEEYLQPSGITVIEWAERWFDEKARFEGRQRRVNIEILGENQRRIHYEDSGA
jgi:tRNA A37 threonylcarbamoyladenosine biosynthesis protein TsaE